MAEVPPLMHITADEVIGEYKPRLKFEGAVVGDVSFQDREWRGVFEPFRDPAVFAEVFVGDQFGTVAWPSGFDVVPSRSTRRLAAIRRVGHRLLGSSD